MALALCCPHLESVSLYWNLQLRDPALVALAVRRCGGSVEMRECLSGALPAKTVLAAADEE